MSRHIAISDDVYRRLKREKGDRSFSEVIEAALDSSGQLADVAGQEIFDAETDERISEEFAQLSEGTFDGIVGDYETETQ